MLGARHGVAALLIALVCLSLVPARAPQAAAQPAPAATCPGELVLGAVFDCGIAAAGEVDSYSFTGATNDSLFFRVLRTNGTFIPRVRVVNADGVQICDTWSNPRAILECVLTSSGTFTLRVFDLNSANTGDYQVYAQRLNGPVQTQPLVIGQLYTGGLTTTIEADVYQLSTSPNDQLEIRVLRTTGSFTPHINVYSATGEEVCRTWSQPLAQSAPCALGTAGPYTLFVDDLNVAATGTYQLIVQRRGLPVEAPAMVPGQVYTGDLATPIATAVYTVTAAINDRLVLRVQRDTGAMVPHIRVFSPGGEQICRTWAQPFAALEPCDVNQAGIYSILIDDLNAAATGTFTLHTQRLNNPGGATALGFGQAQSNRIDKPAALDTYTFEATANDVVSLTMRRTAGAFTPHVRVFDPGGQQICRTWAAPTATLTDCAVATTGRHTIIADDLNAQATGDYTLAIACAEGPCELVGRQFVYIPLVRR